MTINGPASVPRVSKSTVGGYEAGRGVLARSVPMELGATLEGRNVCGHGHWEGMGAGVHAGLWPQTS